MTKNKRSDITDVDGNKVFIENGKVKTLLREDIQKSGFMDVKTAFKIIRTAIVKEYGISYQQSNIQENI